MRDVEVLALLAHYSTHNHSCASNMLDAREAYDDGDMEESWFFLLHWCIAKDERKEAWGKLRPHYWRAWNLKEALL